MRTARRLWPPGHASRSRIRERAGGGVGRVVAHARALDFSALRNHRRQFMVDPDAEPVPHAACSTRRSTASTALAAASVTTPSCRSSTRARRRGSVFRRCSPRRSTLRCAARLTDGLVDPTVGRAMRVLGYDRDSSRTWISDGPPLLVSVERAAGWETIEIDLRRPSVRIPRGVELDFGATAKALCADRAASAIGRATGSGVLIGLGGDVAVGGPVPAEGWTVLIADHHGATAEAVDERIVITSGGLATSGTTARRWARGECVLHHVLDPATGLPAKEHWRTVSVSAASCDANIAARLQS